MSNCFNPANILLPNDCIDVEKWSVIACEDVYKRQTMYRFKYSNRREYAAYFAQTAVERYSDWIQTVSYTHLIYGYGICCY